MNLDVFTVPQFPNEPGREIFNPENAWPGAPDRIFVDTHRSGPLGVLQLGYDPATGIGWARALPEPGAEWGPWSSSVQPPPPLVITSLDPPSMEIGAADEVLDVIGEGFTKASVITFNGGDERTVFVDSTRLQTTVKPSLAGAAITVPIRVRNYARMSNAADFEFTSPAGAGSEAPAVEEESPHDETN